MDYSNKWIYRQIEKSPHGLCIIFNNHFEGDNYREGTDIDKDNLQGTFTDLGYEVIVHNNYPAQTIKDELGHYCLGYSKEIDSLFVCFLTHGGDGYICGNDYNRIRHSELSKIFSQTGCVYKSIPKVIINQACSGRSFGRGQDATNPNVFNNSFVSNDQGLSERNPNVFNNSFGCNNQGLSERNTNVFNNSFVSNNQGLSERNPIFENKDYENYKDFMILSASSPGMPSLRTEDGSPFVHYLCKVLRNHAYEHCFEEMIKLLRSELGKSSVNIEDGVRCTPPTPHGTLDKRLFIHPNDGAYAMAIEDCRKGYIKGNGVYAMAIDDSRKAYIKWMHMI